MPLLRLSPLKPRLDPKPPKGCHHLRHTRLSSFSAIGEMQAHVMVFWVPAERQHWPPPSVICFESGLKVMMLCHRKWKWQSVSANDDLTDWKLHKSWEKRRKEEAYAMAGSQLKPECQVDDASAPLRAKPCPFPATHADLAQDHSSHALTLHELNTFWIYLPCKII